MYRKQIVHDRTTRDYAMYLNGELVGFARTYQEAEVTLDQLARDKLGRTAVAGNDASWLLKAKAFQIVGGDIHEQRLVEHDARRKLDPAALERFVRRRTGGDIQIAAGIEQ